MNLYAKAKHFKIVPKERQKKGKRNVKHKKKKITCAVRLVVLFGFCFPSNTAVNKFLICGFRKTNRNKMQLQLKTLTHADVLITCGLHDKTGEKAKGYWV